MRNGLVVGFCFDDRVIGHVVRRALDGGVDKPWRQKQARCECVSLLVDVTNGGHDRDIDPIDNRLKGASDGEILKAERRPA